MTNCKRFMTTVFLSFFIFINFSTAFPNEYEFDENGINIVTGTKFNPYGYDQYGYDQYGYDYKGFDRNGFDRLGYTFNGFNREKIHRDTNEEYSPIGCNIYGRTRDNIEIFREVCYIHEGFNDLGFNKKGIHRDTRTEWDQFGYDRHGFNRKRIHKDTGTKFSPQRYDYRGFYRNGFNAFTESWFDIFGKDVSNRNRPTGNGLSIFRFFSWLIK